MAIRKLIIVMMAWSASIASAAPVLIKNGSIAVPLSGQQLPPGDYQQDMQSGELLLVRPQRFMVELESPGLYPALEQELRDLQTIQLAPDQELRPHDWQHLRFSQVNAVEARINNEQQIARVQIQSRYPNVKIVGQFSRLQNALTVSINNADAQEQALQLALLPGVKAVHPEQVIRAMLSQSVPLVQAPKVWARQQGGLPIKGSNIRVAVLDTGVDYKHEALGGCFGAGCKVAGGYDFVDKDNDPMDLHSHGTHVASIIAGQSGSITGVAPMASIYAYRVLADNGYGSVFDTIAALEKAIDPDGNPLSNDGAHIINMSLGYSGSSENDPLVVAVNNAVKAGSLVVVSAGNSGPSLASVGIPAIAAEALTVANTDKNDKVAIESSRGPGRRGALLKPDMAAPGTDIYAAVPGQRYEVKSGTSMAAPHVSGAAALLLQANPELSADDLKRRLVQNTDALKQTFWDHGTGRLNVYKAISGSVMFDKAALHLGRVNAPDFANVGTQTVTVLNTSSSVINISPKLLDLPDFISASLDTDKAAIAPGDTRRIVLNYQIDQAKVPDNSPLSGLYQFSIKFDGLPEPLQLPVLLEHYFSLRINTATPISSIEISTPGWGIIHQHRSGWPEVWEQRFVDFRLTNRLVNILAKKANGANELIVRTNIDLAKQTEITFSAEDIKYELARKSITKNSQPFWLKHISGKSTFIELTDGNEAVMAKAYFTICNPKCDLSEFANVKISDVPASFSLKGSEIYQDVMSVPEQIVLTEYRFKQPIQENELIDIDFTELNKVSFRKNANKNYTFLVWANSDERFSKKLNAEIWSKSVGLNDNEMMLSQISFYGHIKGAGNFSTLQWRLTDDGLLQKFHCKRKECSKSNLSDMEMVYSSEVRELSFDNNLRYLSASIELAAQSVKLNTHRQVRDRLYSDGVVSDLWRNDVTAYGQVVSRQYCEGQGQLLEPLKFTLSDGKGDYWTSLKRASDCKDSAIVLSYPLDGRDDKGLLGEVRFELVKPDLESPHFVNLATYNRATQGDTISRINNKFIVEVVSKQDPVKEFKVLLKTKDGEWKLAYHGYNAGVHQFPLPLRAGEQWLDLRLQVITQSGNQLVNTMPEALRLGASAGGDNDVDSDGILNAADTDNDNDSVPDANDAMPYNPSETLDSDQDGLGNNADPDDDNDGTPDVNDAFPLDPAETTDTDKDGIGNNADPDDDNDGVADTADAFPLDPKETLDSDKDGIGNNGDTDDDNDGVADTADAFPLDPKETLDTDKDGIGNNADPDDDNDTVADTADAFPLDANETLDTDKDGIGNNADPDDDNDGVADGSDKYPLDASRSSDPVTPNAGSSGSGGSGGAGLGVLLIALPLLVWRRQHVKPQRKVA